MDANELGRWTRFAEKGGIGKCTAIQHCIAEKPEDLMFMKDDEITVLMLMPGNDDQYLGYCEGVVGNFRGAFVRFHGRLKKPVLTKRQSASMLPSLSRSSSSQSGPTVTPSDSPTLPSQSLAISSVSDSPILPISSSSSSLVPFTQDESYHARPISYSSMSSAMDSAPITPADILGHDISGPNIVTEIDETCVSSSPLDADISATSMHAKIIGMDSPVDPRRDILDSTTARFPQIAEFSLLRDESISFYDSEPSARISVALSDGEVGIGLSLLQDFVDSGADADAETRAACAASNQSSSGTADPSYATDNDVNASAETDPEPTPSIHIPLTSSVSGPPSASSVRSNDSHVSGHLSLAGSSDFEFGGEDWEGASDIYDDYRYSRYSIASKMSRLSKGSMYTVASTSNFEVPPIPAEHVRPVWMR
ncbi:hypothetical protein A0H81_00006 [Grifola frondosa]|uniref:SH3 domain-containing protein n=1 Tax=Grifola frondosa TaxID=5627 RepID=A0A1C7MP42_GRIFR|nr:hypothetical protein A0H81_00006 [Grifola frondosa]